MPFVTVQGWSRRHIPAFEVFDILLGDRPALSPAETFYQRALAGHPEEAIEHAEDVLETSTLASYYDEVVLGGLRLAAADVDRGAVERSALRAVCETTLEVLEALADHRDAQGSGTSLAPMDATPVATGVGHSCHGREERIVISIPGRGPLDPAVAAMMTQLLRRAGCEVRALSRDDMRSQSDPGANQDDADVVCTLGLFDERSFRRILPVVQPRGNVAVLIGVRRTDDVSPSNDSSPRLLPSLAALCDALRDLATANG